MNHNSIIKNKKKWSVMNEYRKYSKGMFFKMTVTGATAEEFAWWMLTATYSKTHVLVQRST